MAATLIFTFGVLFVLYVTVLYPAVLGLLARYRTRPVRRGDSLRTVSVVIAVHDGAEFLREKLASLLALDYPRELMEIIVVSDGSTDATDAIAREHASNGVVLLRLPRSGKAAALNAGIAHARNEILLLTDVRQRVDRDALRHLVSYFDDSEVGVVSGELIILSSASHEQEDVTLYRRYENWFRRRLGRIDSIFGATGCIYAMRRELAVEMPNDTLLDDMYLPLAAFFKGYRLAFDERARAYDYPTALDIEFRRKVRTLAGNIQVIQAYPQLLTFSNRMLFHFLSYKFARLLLPWTFIAILTASFFLPEPLRRIALTGELFIGLLIAIDPMLSERLLLKRLSSPVRTFFTLMAAAMYAVSVFFVPARKLWKETRVVVSSRL